MSILTDIQDLARRYMNKKISLEMWQSYTILKIARIETEDKAEEVARRFASREEDENNV